MEVLRADPLVGVLLDGRYEVASTIARGGMATVYRGRDTRLDRDVAIKVMHPFLADDPEFVDRFSREARAVARISDRHVVAVHDQGTDLETRTVFLVMELVRGRTLRALLDERGRLTAPEALSILEPVAAALAAAHATGVVHRDVKPENVLLGDDGRVLVADFGLARAVSASPMTANAGLLIGTVAYLSPEQVRDGSADQRSDVYSAGILLFELVTGRVPYTGDSPLSVAYRHLHEDVPPTGVSAGIDALLASVTARDPAARPADGAALQELVRSLRRATPPGSSGAPVGAPRNPTRVMPNPLAAGVTAGGTDVLAVQPAAPAVPRQPTRIVEAPVLAERPHGRSNWTPLIVLLVLVLTAGAGYAGWWYGAGRYTHAPKVVGLSASQAGSATSSAHLKLRVLDGVNDDSVQVGEIVSQSPGPGAKIVHGDVVSVHLSLGPVIDKVPAIAAGVTPADAAAALHEAGLSVGTSTQQHSMTVAAGKVIGFAKPAGTPLRHSTRVGLIVSSGPPLVSVPGLVGRTADYASTTLKTSQLVGNRQAAYSDTVQPGLVIDQSVDSGTDAAEGSTVTYHVSRGPAPVTVPTFKDLDKQDAEALAAQNGLHLSTYDLPDGFGTVVAQSPQPGTVLHRGDTVTVEID